jgi:outer membrane protein W
MAGFTTLAMVTIACIAMLKGTVCCAADVKDGFTLGSGTLQPVSTDTAGKNPGVLTAKYGFSLLKDFTPYVGTGLAYVLPQEASVTDPSAKLKTGLAGQAGVSFNLGINSALVIDYKYLRLTNDPSNSDKSTTPPQSVGIGVNIKF